MNGYVSEGRVYIEDRCFCAFGCTHYQEVALREGAPIAFPFLRFHCRVDGCSGGVEWDAFGGVTDGDGWVYAFRFVGV